MVTGAPATAGAGTRRTRRHGVVSSSVENRYSIRSATGSSSRSNSAPLDPSSSVRSRDWWVSSSRRIGPVSPSVVSRYCTSTSVRSAGRGDLVSTARTGRARPMGCTSTSVASATPVRFGHSAPAHGASVREAPVANIVGLTRNTAMSDASTSPSAPVERFAPAGLMSSDGRTWFMSAAVRSTTIRARPRPVSPTIVEAFESPSGVHSANSSALARRPCREGYRCSTRSARSVRRGAKRRAGRTRVRTNQNSTPMKMTSTVARRAVGNRRTKSTSVNTASPDGRELLDHEEHPGLGAEAAQRFSDDRWVDASLTAHLLRYRQTRRRLGEFGRVVGLGHAPPSRRSCNSASQIGDGPRMLSPSQGYRRDARKPRTHL